MRHDPELIRAAAIARRYRAERVATRCALAAAAAAFALVPGRWALAAIGFGQ